MDTANYMRMMNFVSLIQKKPKKNIKYFYFDDGKKFIVDGKKLKLLPMKLQHLNEKDNFYIHTDPLKKVAMYYAYNIPNITSGEPENEEEGYIDWADIETCLYNFFVFNIKELADTTTPYNDIQKDPSADNTSEEKKSSSSEPSYMNPTISEKKYSQDDSYYSSYSLYGTAAYKEREAFFDKINASIKEGRTTSAIDYVIEHFEKMTNDKKFDEVDTLLRLINFDKLNVPTMLEILNATAIIENKLKERSIFFNKVKNHILKLKPNKIDNMLKKYIPEPKKAVSQLN